MGYYPQEDFFFLHGLKLSFYHIPSRTEVSFKAWDIQFSDQFQQEWSEEVVIGRNDPHLVFKNTKRAINFGWTVMAGSLDEAKENHKRMSLLAQMQYPSYNAVVQGSTNVGILNANAIQASPLFKFKFLNWIQDATAPGAMASAKESGLVGKMNDFSFTPDMDSGVFHDEDGSIYAQELNVQISYTVLHTHPLGWQGRKPREVRFPYNDDLSGDEIDRLFGRTPINSEKIRNASGATVEQREAKQKKMEQSTNANLGRLNAGSGGRYGIE